MDAPVRVLVADHEDDIRLLVRLAVRKAGGTVGADVADADLPKPCTVAGLVAQVRELTAGAWA